MPTYTAEDFANASIATRGTHDVARRVDPSSTLPWTYGDSEWEDDQGMAEHGWKPVREVAWAETRRLAETVKEQGAVIASLKSETRAAYARIADSTLSLDTLREAWEQAEVPTEDTPIREGDVMIFPLFAGYCVRPSWGDSPLPEARVLSRAPKPREPWQDLGDKLAVEMPGIEDEPRIEALAKALYCEHGVRVVTGGDES